MPDRVPGRFRPVAGPAPPPPDLTRETFLDFFARAVATGALVCPLILGAFAIPAAGAWILWGVVWREYPVENPVQVAVYTVFGTPLLALMTGLLPGAVAAVALVAVRRVTGPLSPAMLSALVPAASLAAALVFAPLLHALAAAAFMTPMGWLVFWQHRRFRLSGFLEPRRFDRPGIRPDTPKD